MIVETDASKKAVGTVLIPECKIGGTTETRMIQDVKKASKAPKKTLDAQERIGTHSFAIERLRRFLIGITSIVAANHK